MEYWLQEFDDNLMLGMFKFSVKKHFLKKIIPKLKRIKTVKVSNKADKKDRRAFASARFFLNKKMHKFRLC